MTALLGLLRVAWGSSLFRRAVLVVGVAGLLGITYNVGSWSGASKARAEGAKLRAEDAAKWEKLRAEDAAKALAAVARAESAYREKEKAHDRTVESLRIQYAADAARAEASDAALVRDLSAGNKRLRFQVARCDPGSSALGSSAPGVDGAPRAELAPEVGADFYSIPSDGDKAIRKLTALQAWARSAVKLCNGEANP